MTPCRRRAASTAGRQVGARAQGGTLAPHPAAVPAALPNLTASRPSSLLLQTLLAARAARRRTAAGWGACAPTSLAAARARGTRLTSLLPARWVLGGRGRLVGWTPAVPGVAVSSCRLHADRGELQAGLTGHAQHPHAACAAPNTALPPCPRGLQALLAGKLQLRLSWQPIEEEAAPPTLLSPRARQQDEQQQQRQQQQQQAAAAQQEGRAERERSAQRLARPAGGSGELLSPPASARNSLQLPSARGAAGEADQQPQQLGGGLGSVAGSVANLVAASAAAAADAVPQRGVLAVRVAHTKLDYATGEGVWGICCGGAWV